MKYADSRRRDVEYAVGDRVLLSTRNLRLQGPREFRDRLVVPFRVIDRIVNTAYCPDLSGH